MPEYFGYKHVVIPHGNRFGARCRQDVRCTRFFRFTYDCRQRFRQRLIRSYTQDFIEALRADNAASPQIRSQNETIRLASLSVVS